MQQQLVLRAAIIGDWKRQDKITIRWSVIDRQSQQTIYSEIFTGESKVENEESYAASREATKISLEKVLADTKFISSLTKFTDDALPIRQQRIND